MKKVLFILSALFVLSAANYLSAQNTENIITAPNTVNLSVAYCNGIQGTYQTITCEVMPVGYNIWLYNGSRTVRWETCMLDDFTSLQVEVGKKYNVTVGRSIEGGYVYRTFVVTIQPTDKMIIVDLWPNSLTPEVRMYGY